MIRRVFITVLFLTMLVVIPTSGFAQGESGRYYSETGHTLAAQFVDYFDSHGGLEILGYPITDAFVDPWTGLLIQYTQNSRMEYYPETETGTMQVRLKELGVILISDQSKVFSDPISLGSNADCDYYALTGHSVCLAFLEFYDRHGATRLFGFPITDFVLENDRLVQYFQGFRLDWYPENPVGGQVQVAPLGRVHFEAMGYDPYLLRPTTPSNTMMYQIVNLQPKASVEKPATAASDTQEVYVVVRDQNLLPVRGAGITLVASFPGETRTLLMPPTDELGGSRLSLTFSDQDPGTEVGLEFFISTGTVLTTTRDSFRIWW